MTRADQEKLSGQIERITFHSAESGFAVLCVKVRGRRDLTTVIGTLPRPVPKLIRVKNQTQQG